MKNRAIAALILMGFTSLIVQSLMIREFFVSFYGNELTIGLVLACWIIAEALGSGLASRFSDKIKTPSLSYFLLQILIAIYLPISIYLIRGVKNFITPTPGEAMGLLPLAASCALIISPLSVFDGMQYPVGCRIYNLLTGKKEETAGRVYILEAVGFILAGPIFTYILLTRLNSFQIAFLIGLANIISGLLLRGCRGRSPNGPPLTAWSGTTPYIVLIITCSYFLFSNISTRLNDSSAANQWKGQNLAAYKNSRYGNLAVSQKNEQYTFYSNGAPIINIPAPDTASCEEFVHFGLLSGVNPKNILFLSGGAGGPINEVLKYSETAIDYAELDPLLIKLLREFPKGITSKELNDPRVNIIISDGVRYVKNTDKKYDVVFINLPSPSTLQLNRYYTKEFLEQIKGALSENGRLVLSLPGSLSYLNEELINLNLCVLTTLRRAFPYVFVIPGDENIYIASAAPLQASPQIFIERLSQRNIKTDTLDEFHVRDRMQKYWQDWFYETVGRGAARSPRGEAAGRAPIVNTNLSPSGVFYGIAYWNSLFNPPLRGFFKKIAGLKFSYLIFAVIILFFVVIASRSQKGIASPRFAISTSIAATGFVGMSLNLIFILSYQIFFGYVYHHIALLITSFMLGLTLGGWLITKNLEKIRRGLFWFILIEILIIIFSFGSGLLLFQLNKMKNFGFYPLFFILSAIIGFLVGAEFPLANKLYSKDSATAKTAGALYALDLFGAFFAALLVSIIFIPLFGVLKTCLFLAVLKICGLTFYSRLLSG